VKAGAGDDNVTLETEADHATVDLGDGNDRLSDIPGAAATGTWNVSGGAGNDIISGSSGGNTVDAGAGNDNVKGFPSDGSAGLTSSGDRPDQSAGDSIFAGPGNDTIDPGFGGDAVSGGDGNDTFRAGGEADLQAPDAYDGGAGFDTMDYSSRTSPVFFNSGSTRSGAVSPAEVDKVSLVERAVLGAGDDTALSLIESLPTRTYDGRDGNDRLNGGDTSDDTLIGGLGADRMNGFGGNDIIKAKDSTPDTTISCGDGVDLAELDVKDPQPLDPVGCEAITREHVKEAPLVRLASAHLGGSSLHVKLACPRNNDRACMGHLDAAGHSTQYRIGRGKKRSVAVAVGSRGATRLRHRGNVRVTSVERGRFADKTVIRTLKLGR
jgi:hypothetical protein